MMYFTPSTHYRRGDRVLTNVLDKVCVWECITEYTSATQLTPYVYTPTREKVHYWKQLCCEPHNSPTLVQVYYGECTHAIPRNTQSTFAYPEIAADTYENNLFI